MIYKFLIPHTQEEIKQIIDMNTVPYKILDFGYTGKYMGKISGNKIVISKMPSSPKPIVIKIFSGRLYRNDEGYILIGPFGLPSRLLAFQAVLFLLFAAITQKSVFGWLNMCIAYLIFLLITILIATIPDKTKKDILCFIQSKLCK